MKKHLPFVGFSEQCEICTKRKCTDLLCKFVSTISPLESVIKKTKTIDSVCHELQEDLKTIFQFSGFENKLIKYCLVVKRYCMPR